MKLKPGLLQPYIYVAHKWAGKQVSKQLPKCQQLGDTQQQNNSKAIEHGSRPVGLRQGVLVKSVVRSCVLVISH